jgi:hypothetical protein
MARLRRLAPAVAVALTACASPPTPPPDPAAEPARPFIKLANRTLAVGLRFAEPAPTPAWRQDLGRALARRLKDLYRSEVAAHPLPAGGIPVALTVALATAGVDDLVVVAVQPEAGGPALTAKAEVLVLEEHRIWHRVEVPPARGPQGGPPSPEQLADLITLALARRWSDPGAAPAMDPRTVADRLAEQGACAAAQTLYARAPLPRSPTLQEVRRLDASRIRQQRCEETLQTEARLAADAKARFDVRLEVLRLSRPVQDALQKALATGTLRATLAGLTDKPVLVRVTPEAVLMELRYHPERYRAAVKGLPAREGELIPVYLDPFVPAMEALLALRDAAAEGLAPGHRDTLEALPTALRLTKLLDDHVELDFGQDDTGQLLLTDRVLVTTRGFKPSEVQALNDDVTRTRRLLLGPPEDGLGDLTPYGLLLRFLELER